MKFSQNAIVLAIFAIAVAETAYAEGRQTREEYIAKYKSIAVAHMERYGIPASITMAQGILESDSGNSELSRSSNNHFGIKCKKNWKGDRVYHDDDAKGECFRAYPSVEASYQDHAEFLDSSPRYDSLFAYPSNDYRSWARGLKAAGYATAPDYAERLIKIIEDYRLYLLDKVEESGTAYDAYIASSDKSAEWFESQSTASSHELIDPDAFRVTINSCEGYNVYRTNHTCYIVAKEGDTFASLGAIFGITPSMLRKFNDIEGKEEVKAGDVVYIERKKARWEGNALLHVVRHDETLYSLSQSYGIRMKKLARLNSLRPKQRVNNGDTIKLR